MSLQVTGIVMNVFVGRASTDPKTGEVRPAKSKVQLLGEVPLQNGGKKMEMYDFNTDRPSAFQAALNKRVRCPVAMWKGDDGGAGLYIPQGSEIELLNEKGEKTGLLDTPKDKKAA